MSRQTTVLLVIVAILGLWTYSQLHTCQCDNCTCPTEWNENCKCKVCKCDDDCKTKCECVDCPCNCEDGKCQCNDCQCEKCLH